MGCTYIGISDSLRSNISAKICNFRRNLFSSSATPCALQTYLCKHTYAYIQLNICIDKILFCSILEEERTSSPDLDGKKTPDELVRRHGVGHGTNPDLMAEIKEKRASMAVQQPTDESKSAASIDKSTASPSGIFSGVKLR